MNKTFESLKNYVIEADTSISDLLDLYIKKSAELDKVSQLTEDLSKKLLEIYPNEKEGILDLTLIHI